MRKAEPENSSATEAAASASPEDDVPVEEAEAVAVADVGSDNPNAEPEPSVNLKAKQVGIRDRFVAFSDKFAMLTFRAVAFGLIAAAAGVLATMVVRNYEAQNSAGELNRELALRDARLAEIEIRLSSLAENTAPLALGSEVAVLAEGIEQGRIETNRIFAQIEDAMTSASGELDQRIGELDARLAAVEEAPVPPPIQAEGGLPSETTGNVAALETRLDALSEQLMKLEANRATSPAASDTTAEMNSLESRLSEVESRFAALPTRQDDEYRLAEAERRLANLESRMSGDALSAKGLALIGVRAAAATGAPYLRLLRDAGFSDLEIPEVVMIHAETGIATMEELQRSFDGFARAALRATAAQSDGEGGIVDFLTSLIQIRPLTPREGDDPAATLSRAEGSLMAGNVRNALTTLATLSDSAQETLADWILAAEAHTAVLAAIDSMLESPETEQ